jgi:Domain of unknown function (DUF4405)
MPMPTKHDPAEIEKTGPTAPEPKPAAPKSSRTLLNLWVDVALFLAIVVLMWVSAMLQFVFPPPTLADGWKLWGLSFNQWRDVQFYALCVCALLAVEHVVLHWNWVCSVIATRVLRAKKRPDEGAQTIYGVGTFIVILTVMMAAIIVALLTVKQPH